MTLSLEELGHHVLKNSFDEIIEPAKLSITQREESQSSLIDHQEKTLGDNNNLLQEESNEKKLRGQTVIKKSLDEGQCPDCLLLSIVIDELKEALVNSTQFTKADQISRNEIQFIIPNDKYQQVTAAMDNSANSVYVTFDKNGILESAETDTFREKLDNA
jgi:hypothetical protein